MKRSFRLTHRAEASLVEIASWTIATFGSNQADVYETELLTRCQAIVKGQAHSRICAVLVDGTADLRKLSLSTSCIPAAIFPAMSQH